MLEFPALSIDLDQRRCTHAELMGPDPGGRLAVEVRGSPRPARSQLRELEAALTAFEGRAPKQTAMTPVFASATRRRGSERRRPPGMAQYEQMIVDVGSIMRTAFSNYQRPIASSKFDSRPYSESSVDIGQ